MSRMRRKDTKPELRLRRALWSLGLRYRVDYPKVPGRPDIAFPGRRLAVFVDGEFWHGRNWGTLREALLKGNNGKWWVAKIERNMERDREVTRKLIDLGWVVLRFWETEEVQPCALAVMRSFSGLGGR